jgi:hypothetical protein
MDSEKEQNDQAEPAEVRSKANESSGIYVRGFVKISDPDSGEVIIETAN